MIAVIQNLDKLTNLSGSMLLIIAGLTLLETQPRYWPSGVKGQHVGQGANLHRIPIQLQSGGIKIDLAQKPGRLCGGFKWRLAR